MPCKLCDQQLADGGGTTNLLSHLQSKHPEEYKHCTNHDPSTCKQTTLTTVFRKCSPQCAADITDRIAEFVARNLRPLSVVDSAGFKQLVNYLEPGYKVPSRSHVTSICCKKFDVMKEQLLATVTLATVQYVAVTTDIWTSRATQAYITVTVHFLTDRWKMESKVLQTQEMPERHTGVHISERLLKASVEWKISDKVVAVVRDNAANMVLASQFLEDWGDLPCFGHTLQLAVKVLLDLPLISRQTAVCHKIVGHFKHSVVAMGALREKQRGLNIPQHTLLKDVSTR